MGQKTRKLLDTLDATPRPAPAMSRLGFIVFGVILLLIGLPLVAISVLGALGVGEFSEG